MCHCRTKHKIKISDEIYFEFNLFSKMTKVYISFWTKLLRKVFEYLTQFFVLNNIREIFEYLMTKAKRIRI